MGLPELKRRLVCSMTEELRLLASGFSQWHQRKHPFTSGPADSVNEIVRPWGLPSVEQIGTVSEFGRCALRALRLCFRAQKCSRKWLRKYMCNHKHACTRTNTHAHTQATITHRRQAASQAISGLLFEEPKFSILAASGFGTHLS